MNKKTIGVLFVVGIIAFLSYKVFFKNESSVSAKSQPQQNTCSVKGDCPFKNLTIDSDLTTTGEFEHSHGLAVDITSSTRLYIATHNGLDVLINDSNLYRVGKGTDDQMGFVAHPKNAKILFASGHPVTGGNVGVQKSEDGGVTWKKIADGVNGPVDFHAMTISSVNTDLLYGWYDSTLQRSDDGGVTWKLVAAKNLSQVISLTTDPQKADRLYAETASGIMVSDDRGETWNVWSEKFRNDLVIVLAFNPKNTSEALVSTKQQGFLKTTNGGKTWKSMDLPEANGLVLFVAYDPQNPSNLYALLTDQSLYKSTNGGDVWKKIR